MSTWRSLSWLLGLFACASVAQADDLRGLRFIDRAQGLPSVQVHDLTQDAMGRIWFAGPAGLARYDGVSLRVFTPADGLSTQGLRAVAATPAGVFVGTDIGVDRVRSDGRIESLVPPSGWSLGFVEVLLPARDGAVWIGAAGGLAVWHPATGLQEVDDVRIRGHLVTGIAQSGARIWVSGPEFGLLAWDGQQWSQPPDDGWRAVGAVLDLAAGNRGQIYAGGEWGVVELNADGTRVRALTGNQGARVSAVLPDDANGGVWVAIDSGLERLVAAGREFQRSRPVLANARINRLRNDRQGNLWLATDGSGAARLSVLRRFLESAPMPCDGQVFAVRQAGNDQLLVAGDRCSWRASADASRVVERFAWLDGIKTWDFVDAPDGELWAATETGLFRATVHGAQRVAGVHPVVGAPGRALLSHEGEVWIGTVRGAARWTGTSFEPVHTAGGGDIGYVYSFETDNDGAVWIATIGAGLWRWAQGVAQQVILDGVSATANVYDIIIGADGRKAIIADNEIVLVNAGETHIVDSPTGDSVAAWSGLFDAAGDLWLGSASGLLHLDGNSGELLHRVTRSMGLAGDEFTTSRSLGLLSNGALLAGTDGGLTRVHAEPLVKLLEPPVVELGDLRLSGDSLDRTTLPRIVPYGRWTLSMPVYSPWFADETSLTFRTRLIGFDNRWSDVSSQTQARYTGLPSGDYRFVAQAGSPLTGWGESRPLATFSVGKPWWAKPAAMLAYVLAALVFLNLVLHWRTRQLVQRSEHLEREVDLRTGELVLANEALGRANRLKDLTMSTVSHDLRTPLTVLLGFIGVVRADQNVNSGATAQMLTKMDSAARRMLGLVNDLVDVQEIDSGALRLEKELTAPGDFIVDVADSMCELCAAKSIELRTEAEPGLPEVAFDRRRLRQVLENLIGNACKFSNPDSRITLSVTGTSREIVFAVTDQGKGIPADEIDRVFKPFEQTTTLATGGERGAGLGLSIVKRLVELHDGTVSASSTVGEGSTFRVALPIESLTPGQGS